tara:strand:- start:3687 stop:4505 length:819 start_codon:yes stop_codon:yes gene_type:complete
MESESDESINTEEMNELIENKNNSIERSESKSKPKAKSKPKQKSIKQKEQEEGYINDLKNQEEEVEEVEEEVQEEIKPVKSKKNRSEKQKSALEKGRLALKKKRDEKKALEEKTGISMRKKDGRDTIIKHTEKIIYMVENDKGEFVEHKNKPLSKKELKKLENQQKTQAIEKEIGKKLFQKKNGEVDMRSKNKRTPAQIEASKKLVEYNRLKREKQKAEKEKQLKNTVQEAVVDVVTKPMTEVKKMKEEKQFSLTDEQRSALQYKKAKSLFS